MVRPVLVRRFVFTILCENLGVFTLATKLLRESRWIRVFELPNGSELVESRFLTEDIQVLAEDLASFWRASSAQEKQEFIVSYISKPWISAEDDKIITFLMGEGPREVWSMLAILLPRYGDKDKALKFLLERLRDEDVYPKGNYFQALEAVAPERLSATVLQLLDALRARYEQLIDVNVLGEKGVALAHPVWDYLACCRALFVISKHEEYLDRIKLYASSADPQLQNWALHLLSTPHV